MKDCRHEDHDTDVSSVSTKSQAGICCCAAVFLRECRRFAPDPTTCIVLLSPFLLYYAAVQWIRQNTFPIPVLEAETNLPYLVGEKPMTWSWLWSPFQEHRLVFPRLWYLAVARLSNGYDTFICIANTLWLLLATLVCLFGMRGLRSGRLSMRDLFFPLLLLTPGLCFDNWRLGWNGCNTIPVALLLIAGTLLITWPCNASLSRTLLFTLCLILLPLCGIGHVITACCLAIAAVFLCRHLLKQKSDEKKRLQVFFLIVGIVFVGIVAVFVFFGYDSGRESMGVGFSLLASFRLYCSGLLGPRFRVDFLSLIVMLLQLIPLCWGFRILLGRLRGNDSWARENAFLCLVVLLAAGLLIGGIGWGRNQEGLENLTAPRLVSFAMPAHVFLYMLAAKRNPSVPGKRVQGLMLAILVFGIALSPSSLTKDNTFFARELAYHDLWRYRLAETLVNKPNALIPLIHSDGAELAIRHRLGALGRIKPMYFFDELEILYDHRHGETDTPRYVDVEPDSVSIDPASGATSLRVVSASACVVLPAVTVPEGCILVTKVVVEKQGEGIRRPAYFIAREGYREHPLESVGQSRPAVPIIPFLSPFLDFSRVRSAREIRRNETKEILDKIELSDLIGEYMTPVPGDYIIHSIQCRAIPFNDCNR